MLNCGLSLTVLLLVEFAISLECREPVYEYQNLCTIENYNNSIPIDVQLGPTFTHKNIENLRFTKSIIHLLVNDLFKPFINLKTLDLSNCSIDLISIELPIKLQHLNVSNNNLDYLLMNTVWGSKNLSSIDLSYNFISHIDYRAFLGVPAIDTVNLSHNRIQSLPENFTLTYKELNLSFNNITNITFSDKTNVERINLNNNKLRDLQVNEYLEKLSLAHNMITSLQFLNITNSLTDLDLSFNPLNYSESNINLKILSTLPNLKVLILKSTFLNYSNFIMFSKLKELEVLDISTNNLNFIEFNLSHRLEKLKQLSIADNNLTKLNLAEFENFFPKLKTIDITENNFQCSNLRTILGKLKQLNIEVVKSNSKHLSSTGISIEDNRHELSDITDIKKLNFSEQIKLWMEYFKLVMKSNNSTTEHIQRTDGKDFITSIVAYFSRNIVYYVIAIVIITFIIIIIVIRKCIKV